MLGRGPVVVTQFIPWAIMDTYGDTAAPAKTDVYAKQNAPHKVDFNLHWVKCSFNAKASLRAGEQVEFNIRAHAQGEEIATNSDSRLKYEHLNTCIDSKPQSKCSINFGVQF